MVRAPCCEKMGMKKGPWSSEEDHILISFIHHNGHDNWRALPKLAGLSRCGKSCRLRWMNYLRPDIKRGNFSKEEEETIIELHQMLGNRWSAIAAKLPGRTDNEIKNVWHTHLKKKLKNTYQNPQDFKRQPNINNHKCDSNENHNSPQVSTSELSSLTEIPVMFDVIKEEQMYSNEITFSEIDENFWSDELVVDVHDEYLQAQRICTGEVDDDTRFWYNLFIGDGDLVELPGF